MTATLSHKPGEIRRQQHKQRTQSAVVMLPAVSVLLAIGMLAAVGCGGAPGTDPSPALEDTERRPVIHQVIYTDVNGFTPGRLDIQTGDTVVFVNDSSGFFWPASNVHPSHDILPSLNAYKPLKSGETWSHQFTETGYWRYHNHIQPDETGLIVAAGPAKAGLEALDPAAAVAGFPVPPESAAADYDLVDNDEHLKDYLGLYGPTAVVEALWETLPDTGCYARARTAGRVTFEELGRAAFAFNPTEALPAAALRCLSGVYHGAVEALVVTRGVDSFPADVAALCPVTNEPQAHHRCIHNVGRGVMAWTTYELHDSLQLCDMLAGLEDQTLCHEGVFTENIETGPTGPTGHITEHLKYDDAHYPCNFLRDAHMTACYSRQTPHMLTIFNYNYDKVAQSCHTAPRQAQPHCYASYGTAAGSAARGSDDLASVVTRCFLGSDTPHRMTCTQAAAREVFQRPAEADEAITLCGMFDHDPENQNTCYNTIIATAHHIIPSAQLSAFCAELPQTHQQICHNPIPPPGTADPATP